jgi:alkylation response protein AidB-like acyl-CoA dehydrogenase
VPIAISAEQHAVADAIRSWAGRARPHAAARAQETSPDAWRAHWAELADLGLFAVALPAAAGGAGGSVVDLAVMLEAAADALVPGPVLTTALAGLLLERSGAPELLPLLREIAAGELTCGVALGAAGVSAERSADRSLTVHGSSAPVLGADDYSALLLCARDSGAEVWFVIDAETPGLKVAAQAAADFSRPIAEVQLDGVHVPARRVLRGITTPLVNELGATLFAAEAAGVAGWSLRTAVEYAKVREQFGKPIGSFQAIKHLCAEMLCRTELAAAVAWDAAQAACDQVGGDLAGDGAERSVAAATAAAIAFDAAVETTKDCIQVLGGIGFTWEHDAHLYLRRAVATRQLMGGSGRWRRQVAELTLSGARRELHLDLDAHEADRAPVQGTAEQIAAMPADRQRLALAEAGYLAPHWPAPHGLGATPAQQLIIDQELARAGIQRSDLVIAGWAVPTILQHGSEEQIERFVAPTLRGEITWCQLFSEPGAGSDLASLRTRAERVDSGGEAGRGGWRLTGQKVWNSLAEQADWGICLARTDADAPKHEGISYFLVDMRSPGLDVRPLREITGEAVFNEVFLDDVFVPDELVVGEVNDGWRLARTTLANERIAMGGGSSIGDAVEQLLAQAEHSGATADDAVLERLGGLISDGLAGSLLELRSALQQLHGKGGNAGSDAGAVSSVRKLVGVRHRQDVAEAGLELLGPAGALDSEQLHNFLRTRCLSIAGGTTQVLLTLAGERILGLPRG